MGSLVRTLSLYRDENTYLNSAGWEGSREQSELGPSSFTEAENTRVIESLLRDVKSDAHELFSSFKTVDDRNVFLENETKARFGNTRSGNGIDHCDQLITKRERVQVLGRQAHELHPYSQEFFCTSG